MRIKKRNNFFIITLFLVAILPGCSPISHRSVTLDNYLESDPPGVTALWFYPSTVRMASKILGSEYQNSLSPIKEGRIIFTWDTKAEKVKFDFQELQKSMRNEGFESLITMNSSEKSVQAFLKEDKDIPTYILFFKNSETKFVVEAIGELTGEGLKKLTSLDIEEAMNLFEIKPPEEKKEEGGKKPKETS